MGVEVPIGINSYAGICGMWLTCLAPHTILELETIRLKKSNMFRTISKHGGPTHLFVRVLKAINVKDGYYVPVIVLGQIPYIGIF